MSNNSSDAAVDVPDGLPVHLLPRFVERIWGTQNLEPYFAPCADLIGEVWLTAKDCLVEGSSLSLGELATRAPVRFGNADGNGFPLLLKLLFPREKLSVQVHPDDALARTMLSQPRGKTECWYVLSAEPGAQVAVGFREMITLEGMRQAISDGSIESRLRLLDVQAGDMIFVDAGTVHAIGPGIVVLETQQYSDVTYRLWDYGRDRALHIEDGIAVTRTSTEAGRVAPIPMGDFDRLVRCPYFTVDRFRLQPGGKAALGEADQMQVVVALDEGASLWSEPTATWPLPRTHAVLLPAGATPFTLQGERPVEVIRVLAQHMAT